MRILFYWIILILVGITSCKKHEVIPLYTPPNELKNDSLQPITLQITQNGELLLNYSFSYDTMNRLTKAEEIHYKTSTNDTARCTYKYHNTSDLQEKKWKGYLNAGIYGNHEWVDTRFNFEWKNSYLKVSRIEKSVDFSSNSCAQQLSQNLFVIQDLNNSFFYDTIRKVEINRDTFQLFNNDFFSHQVIHEENQLHVTTTFGTPELTVEYPNIDISTNSEVKLILKNLFLADGQVPKDETLSYLYSNPYSYINPTLTLLLERLPTTVNNVNYSYYLDLNNRLVRIETSTGLVIKFNYMNTIDS